jgi:hypothetical protein
MAKQCPACKKFLSDNGRCMTQGCTYYLEWPQSESISNNSDSENEWTSFAGQRENDEQEEDFSFLNSETRQIVLAQNRTTHAIRAFVRFLFIQLSFTTFAGVLFVIASAASSTYSCSQYGECGVSTFFTVAAVLSIIIGIFVSSNAGWSELAKSSIPKRVK